MLWYFGMQVVIIVCDALAPEASMPTSATEIGGEMFLVTSF